MGLGKHYWLRKLLKPPEGKVRALNVTPSVFDVQASAGTYFAVKLMRESI